MDIYIASVAGVLSTLLLAAVYFADRYEREPVELIQNYFLSGLLGQLVLLLAASAFTRQLLWSGPWILVTVVAASLYLPFQLRRQSEMDERFDGIVYTVAFVGGATCVIHLNNLPWVIAVSPYRDALAPGAEPDIRDLAILATSPGFTAEIGQGLVVILTAVLVGAVLGVLQMRGGAPWKTALACVAVAVAATGLDLLSSGNWVARGVLAAVAIAIAAAVKHQSVFRDSPEALERDVLVSGLKTVLVVFGAVLLTTVLLQAAIDPPTLSGEPDIGSGALHEHLTEPQL